MRNEAMIIKEISDWALKNDEVRVVLLTSSRANPNVVADKFSDYDIELVIRNYDSFIADKEWFSLFGEVLITIDGEEKNHYMCMVIYKDHVRIDFRIYSIENFIKIVNREDLIQDWDIGYKVLLDKDNYTRTIKEPTYTAFTIVKPSQEEFKELVTDFWWDKPMLQKVLKEMSCFMLNICLIQ